MKGGLLLCHAGAKEGFFGLFAKYGKPPGWRYGEWDFRPEWDYFGEEDDEVELRFDATKEAWQSGAPIICPLFQHACIALSHSISHACSGGRVVSTLIVDKTIL